MTAGRSLITNSEAGYSCHILGTDTWNGAIWSPSQRRKLERRKQGVRQRALTHCTPSVPGRPTTAQGTCPELTVTCGVAPDTTCWFWAAMFSGQAPLWHGQNCSTLNGFAHSRDDAAKDCEPHVHRNPYSKFHEAWTDEPHPAVTSAKTGFSLGPSGRTQRGAEALGNASDHKQRLHGGFHRKDRQRNFGATGKGRKDAHVMDECPTPSQRRERMAECNAILKFPRSHTRRLMFTAGVMSAITEVGGNASAAHGPVMIPGVGTDVTFPRRQLGACLLKGKEAHKETSSGDNSNILDGFEPLGPDDPDFLRAGKKCKFSDVQERFGLEDPFPNDHEEVGVDWNGTCADGSDTSSSTEGTLSDDNAQLPGPNIRILHPNCRATTFPLSCSTSDRRPTRVPFSPKVKSISFDDAGPPTVPAAACQ